MKPFVVPGDRSIFERDENHPIDKSMLAKFQRRLGLRIFGFVLVWLLVEASLFASDRYDILKAGENLYRDVVVRSQSASSLVVSHAKGIAKIPLSGLSEELQRKYGYDARSDAEREAELDSIRSIQIEASKRRSSDWRKGEKKRRAYWHLEEICPLAGSSLRLELRLRLAPRWIFVQNIGKWELGSASKEGALVARFTRS